MDQVECRFLTRKIRLVVLSSVLRHRNQTHLDLEALATQLRPSVVAQSAWRLQEDA
jgi:hypothetical protein